MATVGLFVPDDEEKECGVWGNMQECRHQISMFC